MLVDLVVVEEVVNAVVCCGRRSVIGIDDNYGPFAVKVALWEWNEAVLDEWLPVNDIVNVGVHGGVCGRERERKC